VAVEVVPQLVRRLAAVAAVRIASARISLALDPPSTSVLAQAAALVRQAAIRGSVQPPLLHLLLAQKVVAQQPRVLLALAVLVRVGFRPVAVLVLAAAMAGLAALH
jgi:hypothetical protein